MQQLRYGTIFFVRHPQIADNTTNVLPGWQDQPLDAKGQKQASEDAKKLSQYPIAHIYTSPLKRAEQNAQAISAATGASVTATAGLLPWNYGDLAGKPNDKANQQVLEAYQMHPDVPTPGGESFNDYTQKRFYPAVEKMRAYVQQHPEAALVASTHSRNLLATRHALGDTSEPISADKSEFPNASIWKAEFSDKFPNGFQLTEI